MNSLGVVVGVLAMFVALAAVFFANIAMRKVDESSQVFLRSHIDPLAAEIAEIRGTLNKTKKLAESHQGDLAGLKELRQELSGALRDIEVRINELKDAAPARPGRSSWSG